MNFKNVQRYVFNIGLIPLNLVKFVIKFGDNKEVFRVFIMILFNLFSF